MMLVSSKNLENRSSNDVLRAVSMLPKPENLEAVEAFVIKRSINLMLGMILDAVLDLSLRLTVVLWNIFNKLDSFPMMAHLFASKTGRFGMSRV